MNILECTYNDKRFLFYGTESFQSADRGGTAVCPPSWRRHYTTDSLTPTLQGDALINAAALTQSVIGRWGSASG